MNALQHTPTPVRILAPPGNPAPPPAAIALRVAPRGTGDMLAAFGPLLLGGLTLYCLDGGNVFDPVPLIEWLRAQRADVRTILSERIFLSRAFTCHQLAGAVDNLLAPLLTTQPPAVSRPGSPNPAWWQTGPEPPAAVRAATDLETECAPLLPNQAPIASAGLEREFLNAHRHPPIPAPGRPRSPNAACSSGPVGDDRFQPAAPIVALVLGVESMFLDEDIRLAERRYLFQRILTQANALARAGLPILITSAAEAQGPWPQNLAAATRLMPSIDRAMPAITSRRFAWQSIEKIP